MSNSVVEAIFSTSYSCNIDPRGRPLSFNKPLKLLVAKSVSEIPSLIVAVEAEAIAGRWVVLLLSYEAAPSFDGAMQTGRPGIFPLALAAVFTEPRVNSTISQSSRYTVGEWRPTVSRAEFNIAINRIRELIAKGDTYQVNYTFPLTTEFSGDAKTWYRDLCAQQRAPYSLYVDLGRFKVLSLSPELFFQRISQNVRTKPMKGTIRRGRWSAEDDMMAQKLYMSAKDRAENVMIVDLLRNDLGRVSVPGSVRVEELFAVERYPTLWQMTSTVEADLKEHTTLLDLLKAVFPCGSITGAPKIRTMEIIKDLELSARQLYTGTVGLIKPGGDCTFSVAIRTVLLDTELGKAVYGVGGGITYDSRAEDEYQECILKSSFLRSSNESFQLLESILLENGSYFLLPLHLARLRSSAAYFYFPFDALRANALLEEIASQHAEGFWKVRLLLSVSGDILCEATRLVPNNTEALSVGLAAAAVDSANPSLYHKKTSNYEAVVRQLGMHDDLDDLIFWNEKGEVTESGVANIVLDIGGKLVTPPISCGLLPGTFRAELLAQGKIVEQRIRVEELRRARQFFLINSVQRWRTAEWAE